MNKKIIFIFVLIIIATISFVSAETIYKDSVSIDDSKVFINVTPHTITSGNQYIYIDFMTKSYTGGVNVVLGYDGNYATPTSFEYWNPHNVTVNKEYTCAYDLEYTTNPNYFWCKQTYNDVNGTYTRTIFEHSFETGDVPTKTAYWTEQEEIFWTPVQTTYDTLSITYDGKDTWKRATGVMVEANTRYKARIQMNIPYLQRGQSQWWDGKYDLAFYPTSYGDNLQGAINDGNLYLIDPWIDGMIFNQYYENFDSVATSDWTAGTIGIEYKYNTTNGYLIPQNSYASSSGKPKYYNLTNDNTTIANSGSLIYTNFLIYSGSVAITNSWASGGINFRNTTSGSEADLLLKIGSGVDNQITVQLQKPDSTNIASISTVTCGILTQDTWYKGSLNITNEAGTYKIIGALYDTTGTKLCNVTLTTTSTYITNSTTYTSAFKDGHGGGSPGYYVDEVIFGYNSTSSSTPATISFLKINNTDITSNILNSKFNITINDTETYNNGTLNLFYLANTSLNNMCSIYENDNCIIKNNFSSITMNKINNTDFNLTLYDTEIYPAYYPYTKNIQNIETGRTNYTVYKDNYLRFNVHNYSINNDADLFNMLEFYATPTPTSNNLLIYYCNSSYTAVKPETTPNCELIDSYNKNGVTHTQNKSIHNTIIYKTNIATTTANSSFIFIGSGNINTAWRFSYIPTQTDYKNNSFQYSTNSETYTNINNIFDIHLHQYKGSDYFTYYAIYNNGTNNVLTSQRFIDFYNITQYPPNAVNIYNPKSTDEYTVSAEKNEYIYFNWTNTTDANNDAFIFKHLSIYNSLNKYVVITETSDLNATYILTNTTQSGNYYINISTCDAFDCDDSNTAYTFKICRNNYTIKPTPCKDGFIQKQYIDSNKCNEQLDFPSDNDTYTSCNNINLDLSSGYSLTDFNIFVILILLFLIVICIIFSDSVLLLFVAMVFNVIIYNATVTNYPALFGLIIIIIFIFLVLKIVYAVGNNKKQ